MNESDRWVGFFFICFLLSLQCLCWLVQAINSKTDEYSPSRSFCVFMTILWSCFLIPMLTFAAYHLGPKLMEYEFATIPVWSLPLVAIYSMVAGAIFYKNVQIVESVTEVKVPGQRKRRDELSDNTGGAIIIGVTWGIWVPIKWACLLLVPLCVFSFHAIYYLIELCVAGYEVIELRRQESKRGIPPVVKKSVAK